MHNGKLSSVNALLSDSNVRPLPPSKGVGFTTDVEAPLLQRVGYRLEKAVVNDFTYCNYHFTPACWEWPKTYDVYSHNKTVDAFSPNLNKQLHVGHLRNLALANSLNSLLPDWKHVSLLGASVGYLQKSMIALTDWFAFIGYVPHIYYDVLLPQDNDVVPRQPGTGKNAGAMVYISPVNGEEMVVVRSNLRDFICSSCGDQVYKVDTGAIKVPVCSTCSVSMTSGKSVVLGKPNYVFHDLAFAATVKPDYYITGAEQAEHFAALGLKNKHLPMGLVLGSDGKKMKSRSGDALSADDAFEMVVRRLKEGTVEAKRLAWNVLAWNFLHVSRQQNVKFDPIKWTSTDAPGMYISYTFARINSALNAASVAGQLCSIVQPNHESLTDLDVKVLGWLSYADYWVHKSIEALDPAPLANYAYDLCVVLTQAYNSENIVGGRPVFHWVMIKALYSLHIVISKLGMFSVQRV